MFNALKNIGSAFVRDFKSGASRIKNAATTAWQTSTLGQNFAGAINAFERTNLNPNKPEPTRPPLEIYRVDPGSGIAYGTNNSNIQTFNEDSGPGKTYYNAQIPGSAGNSAFVNEIRPSTWSAPVDQYGRTSSKTEGQPYVNEQGFTVTPTRGFTGLEGMGGSGFTANSTPATTGMSGVSGTGSRGFASAGQGTTAIAYGQPNSDEEKRKQEEQQKGTVTVNAPTNNPTLNAVNTFAAQGQNQPVTAPDVPQVIDAGWLSQIGESINSTTNSGLSAVDKQAVYAQLTQNLLAAKQRLDQQQPVPENPVVDTPEQMEFMNTSADPFGIKQAMDEFRASQTNLGQLQSTQVELMKNVQALNEAYRPILKEIRENPNLPKALARRKIEALAVTQKETLQGFLDQLDIVKEQIGNENEKVNRQFQILTMAQNQQNRQEDNARAMLSIYSSNPHLLLGMGDTELKNEATKLGTKLSSLQALREMALNPKASRQDVDKNGDLVFFDDRGNEVKRIKGFGAGTGGGANYSSGGVKISANTLKNGIDKLEASRGSDGYADPSVYLQAYKDWPGLPNDFLSQFPPEKYVNPANTWLPKILMPKSEVPTINFSSK